MISWTAESLEGRPSKWRATNAYERSKSLLPIRLQPRRCLGGLSAGRIQRLALWLRSSGPGGVCEGGAQGAQEGDQVLLLLGGELSRSEGELLVMPSALRPLQGGVEVDDLFEGLELALMHVWGRVGDVAQAGGAHLAELVCVGDQQLDEVSCLALALI